MVNEQVSMSNSEQGKREELLGRKNAAWNDFYLRDLFPEAIKRDDDLLKIGLEWKVNPEVIVEILADRAWAEYRNDKKGATKISTSYNSAKEGLEKLKDSEDTSRIHVLRSRLFEVAGLCQAYLVDEKDSKAEPLLWESVKEANKSGVKARIAEAKNGLGAWLISPKESRFAEAISVFKEALQDVAGVLEEANAKRTAGNIHHNLVVCYRETDRLPEALIEGDKALELYGDPYSDNSFSVRFKKSIALRRLGRFEEALEIYELHKRLRSEDSKLSEQERARFIANEDKNIEATKQEMQNLSTN